MILFDSCLVAVLELFIVYVIADILERYSTDVYISISAEHLDLKTETESSATLKPNFYLTLWSQQKYLFK